MQIVLKNLNTDQSPKVRLIPSTYATADLGTQTGAVVLDDGVVNICFAPHTNNTISCDGAMKETAPLLLGGLYDVELDGIIGGPTFDLSNPSDANMLQGMLLDNQINMVIVPESPGFHSSITDTALVVGQYKFTVAIDATMIPFDQTYASAPTWTTLATDIATAVNAVLPNTILVTNTGDPYDQALSTDLTGYRFFFFTGGPEPDRNNEFNCAGTFERYTDVYDLRSMAIIPSEESGTVPVFSVFGFDTLYSAGVYK